MNKTPMKKSLRNKLIHSHMTIALICVFILLGTLFFTVWLRDHVHQLSSLRGPTVQASLQTLSGVQRSLAALRGWITLGDTKFKKERLRAWKEEIWPAYLELEELGADWAGSKDKEYLIEIKDLLVGLEEAQWWVEDVAQTIGNEPAQLMASQEIELITDDIFSFITTLIDLEKEQSAELERKTLLWNMANFRGAFTRSQSFFAHFVANADPKNEKEFYDFFDLANTNLQSILDKSALLTTQQNEFATLIKEQFEVYRQRVEKAFQVRKSDQWNVSRYKLAKFAVPKAERVTELLTTISKNQSKLMRDDGAFVNKVSNLLVILLFILVFCMIILAYFVSNYRAKKITQPVLQLLQGTKDYAAGKLVKNIAITSQDEIGELTAEFNTMITTLDANSQQLVASEQQLKASNQQLMANEQQLKAANEQLMAVVDDLKKKSKELEKATVRAEGLAKAKSNFLANMSHEIRTPMNSILGFSDLLKKTSLDKKQQDYLNTVRSSGSLLIGIIDDILDISKLESGKIRLENFDFNLEELIYDVFKMIISRMKDRPFDTYVDIDKNVPAYVKSDPTRLKQVLVNLLGNAVKFTSEGQIGVMVHLEDDNQEDGTIKLKFVVKDSGIGIAKDKLDAVFQSFTQADETTTRKFGGTGLGLSISKAIVEMMGGQIWVESEEGQGSEFIFTVRLQKAEIVDEKESADSNIKRLKDKKVFIVDDNEISRKIMNKCCEEMDLKIVGIADSPYAALQKFDKLIESKGIMPDLLLCDIMMEGMDGFELVEKLKSNEALQNLKCIAVTADLGAESSHKATSELFDAYIVKPVSLSGMIGVIKRVLNITDETQEEQEGKEEDCRGIRVLVAEDSAPNQMLIQAYFEELKCEGDYANNGQEAIDKLKTNEYDLCLMDLQMPILGGIEATQIIRKEISQDFPIIALTAAVLKEDREKAQAAGMNDFLAKPLNIQKLREKIIQYGRK